MRGSATASLGVGLLAAAAVRRRPGVRRPVPDYEMPFPCGQVWRGVHPLEPRPSYTPSTSTAPDYREPPSRRRRAWSPGSKGPRHRSYGRYVVVDHGNGDDALYAHLDATLGQGRRSVDQGGCSELVGTSGGSSGPHLHFEERLNGRVQKPWFHQAEFVMPATLASKNCANAPVVGDWNGDGADEVAVFRRRPRRSSGSPRPAPAPWSARLTDQPVVGDWDGDGVTDLGGPPAEGQPLLAQDGRAAPP